MFLFSQVVAGVLVHLTLELGYSTCRKGHDTDIATCQLKNDLVMTMCMVRFLLYEIASFHISLLLLCSLFLSWIFFFVEKQSEADCSLHVLCLQSFPEDLNSRFLWNVIYAVNPCYNELIGGTGCPLLLTSAITKRRDIHRNTPYDT
jgi:hypothetical protein